MFQNSSEMQQIFQNGRRQLRRRKAIPKTASEALLAVKKVKKGLKELIEVQKKF